MKVGLGAGTGRSDVIPANLIVFNVERLPYVSEEVVDEVERLLDLCGAQGGVHHALGVVCDGGGWGSRQWWIISSLNPVALTKASSTSAVARFNHRAHTAQRVI